MGEPLISGMLRAGVPPAEVVAAVRRDERAGQLRDSSGIGVPVSGGGPAAADTLVITVKPQDMSALLDDIAASVSADTLVISVAAGITTSFIEHRLGA